MVSHEMDGTAIAVGEKITKFEISNRVGIGAFSNSSIRSNRCTSDNVQYYSRSGPTYNQPDSFSRDYATLGSNASFSIAKEKF